MTCVDIKKMHDMVRAHIGLSVRVVLGGSKSLGEGHTYSDVDVYLVTHRLRDIWIILKHKERIKQIKKECGVNDPLILISGHLFQKWYYAYGVDQDGNIYAPEFDPALLRVNAIKRAYRELCLAVFDIPEKRRFHIRKAFVQAIYADAFFHKKLFLFRQPLFSIHAVTKYIDECDCLKDKERMHQVMACKIDSEQYVKDFVERIYKEQKKKMFSFRLWIISVVFALKQGNVRDVFVFHDQHIITILQRAYNEKDIDLFKTVVKKINYILYI